MATAKYNIEAISNHISTFGEAPFWSEKQQKLIHVDCFRKEVCLLDLSTKQTERYQLQIPGLSAAVDYITAAIPYASSTTEESTYLVLALNKLYKFNSKTNELTIVHQMSSDEHTFHDGKCDERGRLWVGSLKLETHEAFEVEMFNNDGGILHCIDGNYERRICDTKYQLPNGLSWNSDYTKLYWVDFLKRVIWEYDFEANSTSLGNKRVLINFNGNAEYKEFGGFPDGISADLDGNLWVACWEGGRIAKISTSSGELLDTIKMPFPKVTSLCFGGSDYSEMLVTTTSVGLDQVDTGIPDSGKIFRITCPDKPFRGFKQNCFVETSVTTETE